MKKRIFTWLSVAILVMATLVFPVSAEQIGILDYDVPERVNIGAAKTATFNITVPKPSASDTYTKYGGVTFALQLPDGISLDDIKVKYNLTGGMEMEPDEDSSGIIWFSKYNSPEVGNIFADDMICTITVNYSGVSSKTITVMEVTQTYYRSEKNADRKVSDRKASVTLVPDSEVVNTDATLNALSVNDNTTPAVNRALDPSFDPGVTSYTVNVPNSVNSITITAIANAASSGATVTGAGVKSLNVGANAFDITVTAPDGTSKITYKITVTRATEDDTKKDATLRTLAVIGYSLNPSFNPSLTSYAVSVGYSTASVTVEAEANNKAGGAKVSIQGRSVTNGVVALNEGANDVVVTVTAVDGKTKKVYNITINRPSPPSGGDSGKTDGTSPNSNMNSTDNENPQDDVTVATEAIPLDATATMLLLDKSGANGYISGYPDNTTRAENNITRYEAAVILYNLLADKPTTVPAEGISRFSDVEADQWYSKAVGYLTLKEVLSGYPDGTFKGNNIITRAEFATLASKFSVENLAKDIPFPDVQISHWAFTNISSAYNNGLVNGYPDGTFGPERNISRAESFVIMNKLLGWDASAVTDGKTKFTDLAGDEWYYNDVVLAVNGKPSE